MAVRPRASATGTTACNRSWSSPSCCGRAARARSISSPRRASARSPPIPASCSCRAVRFASFSDSAEEVPLLPGIVARLALRANVPALLNTLAHPAPLASHDSVSLTLRNLLWWDGDRREAAPLTDANLPAAGIARLTARTIDDQPLVVVIKAGHNAENHNHNDIVHPPHRPRNLPGRPRPRPLRPRLLQRPPLREYLRQLLRPRRPAHRRAIAGHRPNLHRHPHHRRTGGHPRPPRPRRSSSARHTHSRP